MRSALAPLLLLVAACGGSSGSSGGQPGPVTPAPVPAPAAEQEPADALTESADESGARTNDAPPSADEARARAAIARLTADPPAAYYLPGDGTALVGRAVRVADGGSEVSALLLSAGGKSEEAAAWRTGAGDEAAHTGEVQRLLAARLAGKEMVELTYTPWPAGKSSLAVAVPKMTVTWKKNALAARVGSKRVAVGKVEAVAPHVPHPAGVFAGERSPAALVVVRHDPTGTSAEQLGVLVDVLRFEVPGAAR